MMAPKSSRLWSILFISHPNHALETTLNRNRREKEKKEYFEMENMFNEGEEPYFDFSYDVLGMLVSKPHLTNVATHVQYTMLLETGEETQKLVLLCDKRNEEIPKVHKAEHQIGRLVLIRDMSCLEEGFFWRDCRNDGLPEIILFNEAETDKRLESFDKVSFFKLFVY